MPDVYGQPEEQKGPRVARKRVSCPFYGFAWTMADVMLETFGNQCALIRDAHSPCRMEKEMEEPLLAGCRLAVTTGIPAIALANTMVACEGEDLVSLAHWAAESIKGD